jgi:hypothetical protein
MTLPKTDISLPPRTVTKNSERQGRPQERSKPASTSQHSTLKPPSTPSSSRSSSAAPKFLTPREKKRMEFHLAKIAASRNKSQSRSREATPSPKAQTPVQSSLKPAAPCFQQASAPGCPPLRPITKPFRPRQILQSPRTNTQSQHVNPQQTIVQNMKLNKKYDGPPPLYYAAREHWPNEIGQALPSLQAWPANDGFKARAWTSVTGIGLGETWAAKDGRGHGGVMYGEPRKWTEGEKERAWGRVWK